ncbi:MAG TPA: CARDB domain-containing protein [Thermoanaerobaculaceae bacterium]|nr:CARDB domain-containing protein [Thermoanaerobaculaceae bacterium]
MDRSVVCASGLACIVVGLAAAAAAAPPTPNQPGPQRTQAAMAATSLLRPDLVVEAISVSGTHADPSGGTRVDLTYTVANTTSVDCSKFPTTRGTVFWFDHREQGPLVFSAVDVRVLPDGAFPPPPQYPSGNVCAATLTAYARKTCSASVVVPAGKNVEIRATADALDYIAERNEGNNTRSLTWPPPAIQTRTR